MTVQFFLLLQSTSRKTVMSYAGVGTGNVSWGGVDGHNIVPSLSLPNANTSGTMPMVRPLWSPLPCSWSQGVQSEADRALYARQKWATAETAKKV